MKKEFNWGIIGTGGIAHKFATALQVLPQAKIHAVASRSLEKAQSFAGEFGVLHAYGSYEKLMENKELDVVYIATPHNLHCENTLMCLEQKIPVLCEKPFAINSSEVDKMIKAASENKVFLMEAMWTRFLPHIFTTLNLIREGRIGAIKLLRADFGIQIPWDPKHRVFNPELGGGSLLDVGIYPAFLSLLLFGMPEKIEATATLGKTNVDESCGMLFHYADGQIASLFSSVVARTGVEAEIIGEHGRILIHKEFFLPTSLTLILNDGTTEKINPDYIGNGMNYEAAEVMKCLEEEKLESSLMSFDMSRKLISLLDQIRKKCGVVYPDHD